MVASTALLSVHLQRALQKVKDARKKQLSQNSQRFPNVYLQVAFLLPFVSVVATRSYHVLLLGIFGIVWYLIWMMTVYESPATHPTISDEEKNLIQATALDLSNVR